MSARRIEVQIERLTLDGFEAGAEHAIARAISHALKQRFAEHAQPLAARDAIGPVDVGARPAPRR